MIRRLLDRLAIFVSMAEPPASLEPKVPFSYKRREPRTIIGIDPGAGISGYGVILDDVLDKTYRAMSVSFHVLRSEQSPEERFMNEMRAARGLPEIAPVRFDSMSALRDAIQEWTRDVEERKHLDRVAASVGMRRVLAKPARFGTLELSDSELRARLLAVLNGLDSK